MTPSDAPPAEMNLDCLSCLLPDAARAERTRVRCRTRVARHRPVAHADPAAAPRSPLLAPAVIGGVCVLYLVALMTTSLRLDVFRP